MDPLAVLVRDPDLARLAADIAGTSNPGVIQGRWEDWCSRHLGTDLADLGAKTLPEGRLWPVPHSPLFDFEATAAGAEAFLDDYAASRGPGFTAADRRAASAYARYTRAYKDRCVHALR